jgi:hypothetical protein
MLLSALPRRRFRKFVLARAQSWGRMSKIALLERAARFGAYIPACGARSRGPPGRPPLEVAGRACPRGPIRTPESTWPLPWCDVAAGTAAGAGTAPVYLGTVDGEMRLNNPRRMAVTEWERLQGTGRPCACPQWKGNHKGCPYGWRCTGRGNRAPTRAREMWPNGW